MSIDNNETVEASKELKVPFFLVALPQLDDEYFMRTVVLITEHQTTGATGYILNKPLVDDEEGPALMRAEVKDMEGNTVFEFNEDLFDGGPVDEDSICVLHDIEGIGPLESELSDSGLYVVNDPNLFQKLLESEDYKDRRRFFLGRATWPEGQLDSELRTGAWVPVNLDRTLIFDCPEDEDKSKWRDEVWQRLLISKGINPFTLIGQGPADHGSN